MFVGDLFIELGVKGAEKTIGALSGVRKNLKDVSSMSLEAKAAILGAVYALERMMSGAAVRGQGISNVSMELGIGKQALQQYEQAAKSAGGSVEGLDATLRTLQSSLTDQMFTGHASQGFWQISKLTNIKQEDLKGLAEHPEKYLSKLQEYYNKEKNIPLRNMNLRAAGVSPEIMALFERQAFTPPKLKAAKQFTFSDKEVDNLDEVAKGLTRLGQVIDTAFGHFTSKHGKELIADITMLIKPMTELAETFIKFSETAHVFELIKKSLEGWADIIKVVTSGIKEITDVVSDPKKYFEKQKTAYDERQQWREQQKVAEEKQRQVDARVKEKILRGEKIPLSGYDNKGNRLFIKENGSEYKNPFSTGTPYANGPKGREWDKGATVGEAADKLKGIAGSIRDSVRSDKPKTTPLGTRNPVVPPLRVDKTNNNSASVDVKQELNFYNDPNPVKQMGDSLHKATRDIFRTSPALGQIS